MSESVVEQGTEQQAETPADNLTEATSQLPTGEPPAAEPEAQETEATETQAAEKAETEGEAQTEAQKAEGRGKWDKERQKANERAAELEKQNAKLIELLTSKQAAPAAQVTTPPPVEPEVDLEALHAEVEKATAKAEETFDPADAVAAQKLANKLNGAILAQRKREKAEREKLEQQIKARDERDAMSVRDQQILAALKADWNKSGITEAEGKQLMDQAFQRADARGLKGAERHAAAEMAYDILLTGLKQSKKSQTTTTQTATASRPGGKTPTGTKLTPIISGVRSDPTQRASAAKTIAADLAM